MSDALLRLRSNIGKTIGYRKPTDIVLAFFFSLFVSTSIFFGLWLDEVLMAREAVCFCLLCCIFLCPVVLWIWHKLNGRANIERERNPTRAQSRTVFLVAFIAIELSCLIALLGHYPGYATNDSNSSINQALNIAWEQSGIGGLSNHHPVVFTFVVTFFVRIGVLVGNLGLGVALFSLFQMTCLAATLAYVTWWLYRRGGVPPWFVVATAAFFALNPIIPRYAITMWKDILFSAVLLLFILALFDLVRSNSALRTHKSWLVRFIALTLGVFFLRSNGIYILLATFAIGLIFYQPLRKFCLMFLVGTLVVSICWSGIISLTGIKSGSFAESVGIPLQQLGAAFSYGNYNDTDVDKMEDFIPLDELKTGYDKTLADGIKFNEAFNDEYLNTHKSEFLDLYLSMAPRNLIPYIEAWGWQTRGYWDPSVSSWLIVPSAYLGNDAQSFLPSIDNAYNSDMKHFATLAYPLLSVGMLTWVLLFTLLFQAYRRGQLLPLLPLAVLIGTMLIAAPAWCEFRYVFAVHLALPLMIALCLYGNRISPITKTTDNRMKKPTIPNTQGVLGNE